jgi:hypothetical protein
VTTIRSILGINKTTHYYLDYPIQYTIIYVGIILFYFFILFPISVALLLDAFSKTVIELGSISDKQETQLVTWQDVKQRVFVLRPWHVLEEATVE